MSNVCLVWLKNGEKQTRNHHEQTQKQTYRKQTVLSKGVYQSIVKLPEVGGPIPPLHPGHTHREPKQGTASMIVQFINNSVVNSSVVNSSVGNCSVRLIVPLSIYPFTSVADTNPDLIVKNETGSATLVYTTYIRS